MRRASPAIERTMLAANGTSKCALPNVEPPSSISSSTSSGVAFSNSSAARWRIRSRSAGAAAAHDAFAASAASIAARMCSALAMKMRANGRWFAGLTTSQRADGGTSIVFPAIYGVENMVSSHDAVCGKNQVTTNNFRKTIRTRTAHARVRPMRIFRFCMGNVKRLRWSLRPTHDALCPRRVSAWPIADPR